MHAIWDAKRHAPIDVNNKVRSEVITLLQRIFANLTIPMFGNLQDFCLTSVQCGGAFGTCFLYAWAHSNPKYRATNGGSIFASFFSSPTQGAERNLFRASHYIASW